MPMTQPLRVPIRQSSRVHLERRAQGALQQIARTLRHAQIRAKARVQYNAQGRGRIVVYVQGRGVIESQLLLRPWIEGFAILVV